MADAGNTVLERNRGGWNLALPMGVSFRRFDFRATSDVAGSLM